MPYLLPYILADKSSTAEFYAAHSELLIAVFVITAIAFVAALLCFRGEYVCFGDYVFLCLVIAMFAFLLAYVSIPVIYDVVSSLWGFLEGVLS